MSDLFICTQVCRAGDSVSYALDGDFVVAWHNARLIQTIGKHPQFFTIDAKPAN